ncbi:CpaF family protein [archaeon CG10_big_fil_rev_8_21_14_0_10_43_11]|nr:MAG: CpaF family protein [archaeon CG10_big_fil_rev_8_21_14_0_10_43_11]
MKETVLDTYTMEVDFVPVTIRIARRENEFVPLYLVTLPHIPRGTQVLMQHIRENIVATYSISRQDVLDVNKLTELKQTFFKNITRIIAEEVPTLSQPQQKILAGTLIQNMLGLGKIEVLIADSNLEEVVINNSNEPVWVYHKQFGWLKSDVTLSDDEVIYNYSSKIGRGVGKDITTLSPLMDAHLMTGDRVNATLFPISTKGNTITIRKFRRNPWTVIELIKNKTLSAEVAAFLWIAVEYEISIIISGGTASGKSSFLAALLPFIPPNQRVVSIEETRELQLPKFLHWVPLSTRGANPEGKGEVTMLDLLINSLRMRPDRIIVGEVRRQKEAEVMFEAMHTGHSVYATVHADTAEQTTRRMTSPPINLPLEEIETLPLIAVMFRHRRRGIRRLFQIAEIISTNKELDETEINMLYRWRPVDDKITIVNESIRLLNELRLHTGMEQEDLNRELLRRKKILEWMVAKNITALNDVGRIISEFYFDDKTIEDYASKNKSPTELLHTLQEKEEQKEKGMLPEEKTRMEKEGYACKKCAKTFSRPLELARHTRSTHPHGAKPVHARATKKKSGQKSAKKKNARKKSAKKRAKTRGATKKPARKVAKNSLKKSGVKKKPAKKQAAKKKRVTKKSAKKRVARVAKK